MTQNLKIRAYLIRNFMELDMKKFSDPKTLTSEVWDQKLVWGNLDPKPLAKDLSKH